MSESRKYPTIAEAREEILEIGRRMYQKGFVAANDGNISCLIGPDRLLTTPTGMSKGFMTAADLVETDLSGRVITGGRPSTELPAHLRVYQENPEAGAVVHAHSPAATAFACAGMALDQPVLAEAVVQLGQVPLAPFALPGTPEVPDSIAPFCRDYGAVLLANHGLLSVGSSLPLAFSTAEEIEFVCQIYCHAKSMGEPRLLTDAQMEEALQRFTTYGKAAPAKK